MAPLLSNVFVWTARSPYDPASGQTQAVQPYLCEVIGHIHPVTGQTSLKILPTSAVESDYVLIVDEGTDIVEHDVITKITLLDKVTPWPSLGLAMPGLGPQETFWITFAYEEGAFALASRYVYLARVTASGQVYL